MIGDYVMSTSIMNAESVKCNDDSMYTVAVPPKEGAKGFKLTDCKAKKDKETGNYALTAVLNGRQSDNADEVIPDGTLLPNGSKAKSRGTVFEDQIISLQGVPLEGLIASKLTKALYDIDSDGWRKFIESEKEICELDLFATKGEGRSKVAEEYKTVLAMFKEAAEDADHKGTLADGVTKLTHQWLRGVELDQEHTKHNGIVALLTQERAKIAERGEQAKGLDIS